MDGCCMPERMQVLIKVTHSVARRFVVDSAVCTDMHIGRACLYMSVWDVHWGLHGFG